MEFESCEKSNYNDKILEIINDIQNELLTPTAIRKKYNLSEYRYYKIMDEHNLKTEKFKRGPRGPTGPKKTKFKTLLYGTEEEQKEAKIIPENLNIEDFKTDCTINKLKINELMSKYNLSLYQVRELRIAYDVKSK
jgi:Mor family transcriptional regulator